MYTTIIIIHTTAHTVYVHNVKGVHVSNKALNNLSSNKMMTKRSCMYTNAL